MATEKERFESELEFVQALANPEYLHYLAQHRYLDEDSFVDYLDYLQYWREPQYCKYILFPHCLRMLELLQHASFREALKREDFKTMIFNQQNWHWRFRAGVEDTTAGTAAGIAAGIAAGTEPAPA